MKTTTAAVQAAMTGNFLAAVKVQAAAQVAQYPQYKHAFDNCTTLVRVTRDVKTKMGLSFMKNEVAMMMPDGSSGPGFVTLWSLRTGCATSVRASWTKAA